MFILANLLEALALIINYLLTIYFWIVIARAVISWVNPDPFNPVVRFLYAVTEPVLSPFRRLIPFYGMGIDLSPILLLLLIAFLKSFLVKTLIQLAFRLR